MCHGCGQRKDATNPASIPAHPHEPANTRTLSRRSVLALGTSLAAGALAGLWSCQDSPENKSPALTGRPATTPQSPLSAIPASPTSRPATQSSSTRQPTPDLGSEVFPDSRGLAMAKLSDAPVIVVPRSDWTSARPHLDQIDPMNGVSLITVHHTAMGLQTDAWRPTAGELETIREFHAGTRPTDRKWADIAYHFAVDRAGRVWQARPLAYQGAHVRGHNEHNLGIVLLGNFEVQSPSAAQLTALMAFIDFTRRLYKVPLSQIFTHGELGQTDCPGKILQAFMDRTRTRWAAHEGIAWQPATRPAGTQAASGAGALAGNHAAIRSFTPTTPLSGKSNRSPSEIFPWSSLMTKPAYSLLAAAIAVSFALPVTVADKPLWLDPSQPADQRARDLISRLTLEQKAQLLNHVAPEPGTVIGTGDDAYTIRADQWNQCLHGVVWDRPTTMFPISIALAATWNPDLAHEEATVISDEARAIYNGWHQNPPLPGQKKGLIYRAPVINISRNPYWGRINECFGEDPYLDGRIGVAYVKGLQGDDPKYLKLVSTLKHYAVNNVEQNRQNLSATVSERMLYEYWLPHFKDCIIEGQAQSIMASYNAINGVHNNMNSFLLTDILKKQWGFQGFVVSDLGGVASMMRDTKMTAADAVAKSIVAGCDFSDKEFMDNIPAAVRSGALPVERLDNAVFRVMRDRIRLGDFDPPELVPYSKISPETIASPEHRALSLKVAQQSMVLLANKDNLLPLDKTKIKSIAVLGPHANLFTAGGYSGRASSPVTPLQGLHNRAGEAIQITTTPGGFIGRGGRGGPPADPAAEIQNAANLAKAADIAIVFVGSDLNVEAEGRDRTTLALTGNQEQLVEAVAAANPKTIVVEMNAGPLAVPWIAEHVPAILEAWWAGEEGGNAIADVLFGNVNPAGRMPLTVYASADQVPPQDQYDITKGFTYMYINGKPLFAFGHGLSYTQFQYSNLQLASKEIADNGKVLAKVDIINTGHRPGDEVAQLYIHQVQSSIKRPALELRAFQRITLAPGEKKTVSFEVPAEKLAFYDEKIHGFVVEPGAFDVMIGAASDDIRLTGQIQVRKAAPN